MKLFKHSHFIFYFLLSFFFLIKPLSSVAQNDDPTHQYFEISKSIEILTNVFKDLNQYYVDPIYPGKMTKEGINAMLAELDPYTNFFTEADAENFKNQSNGEYGGIGITTMTIDSNFVIGSVFENSPADKAGLHPGNIILSVNNNDLKGKTITELGALVLGGKGTTLDLEVQNPISCEKRKVSITRSTISLSNVPYAGLLGKNKDIAYVKLTQFMGPASTNIRLALDSLKKIQPDLKGVVLDLRGNPGGLLKEAVRTCNLFIPEGQTVVITKGKSDNWKKTFQTTGQPWDLNIPLAVLVNHQSASASEIVAGTIQDLDRGVIIGTLSFGKGLVQQVKPLGYNTSLKLTVAHYYTPSGRCIQALDYAHRNPDGSVSKISDSLKHTFKTLNGRIVKDGGGIKPDIFIPEEEPGSLLETLMTKNYLFNYATKYYFQHPTIAPAESFHLNKKDFTDFKDWLKNQDFSLQTKEGELLNQLGIEAKKEDRFEEIKNEYSALANQLKMNANNNLDKQSPKILKLLSTEISGRYYYQKGETLNKLSQDDPTLSKALSILQNKAAYQKILK